MANAFGSSRNCVSAIMYHIWNGDVRKEGIYDTRRKRKYYNIEVEQGIKVTRPKSALGRDRQFNG
jgi:hypothetical protein